MIGIFFSLALAASIPTPKRPTGIVWNENAKDVILEMYGDPLCPDCLEAWDGMMKVVAEYSEHVQLRLHLLPLPYHTWAFAITKFICGVKNISAVKARDFANALYTGDQNLFENEPLMNYTQAQVVEYMANYASEKFDISKEELITQFGDAEGNARIEFKYAAAHGVAGTPTFFVNGAEVEPEDRTIESWRKILDPLIN